MKITYKTKSLERLCTNAREMRKRRADIEKRLRLRIFALEANPSLADLVENDPLGEWHALRENRAGQWVGKVSANERLIIVPRPSGTVEVESKLQATEAEVQGIEDYHRR